MIARELPVTQPSCQSKKKRKKKCKFFVYSLKKIQRDRIKSNVNERHWRRQIQTGPFWLKDIFPCKVAKVLSILRRTLERAEENLLSNVMSIHLYEYYIAASSAAAVAAAPSVSFMVIPVYPIHTHTHLMIFARPAVVLRRCAFGQRESVVGFSTHWPTRNAEK